MNSRRLSVWLLLLVAVACWAGPSLFVRGEEDDHDDTNGCEQGSEGESHNSCEVKSVSSEEDDDEDGDGDGDDDQEVYEERAKEMCKCGCGPAPETTKGSTPTTASTSTTASSTTTTETTSTSTTTASTSVSTSTSSIASTTTSNGTKCPDELDDGEQCPCEMMRGLKKIKKRWLLTLVEQDLFEELLKLIRKVLVDVTKSEEEKVIEITFVIKEFCKKNKEIGRKILYKLISIKWVLADFLKIGMRLVGKKAYPMFISDGEGNCNVTDSFEKEIANDTCGVGSTAKIMEIFAKIKLRFGKPTPGDNLSRKIGAFKKLVVKMLFVLLSEYSQCLRNIKIKGLGSLDRVLMVCSEYERSSSMVDSIINGAPENCSMIRSMREHINASSNSTSPNTTAEAKKFEKECTDYFSLTADIVLRLKFVARKFALLRPSVRRFLMSCLIKYTFLNYDDDEVHFYDCVNTHFYCNRTGCDNMQDGPPSQTLEEANYRDGRNESEVWNAVCRYNRTVNASEWSQWATYFNSINKCIHDGKPPMSFKGDKPGRLACTKYYCQLYYKTLKTRPYLKNKFVTCEIFTVFIETITTIIFSTLGMLTECVCYKT